MRLMWIVLATLASCWLAVVLLLALFQDRLLFFPTDALDATPAAAGLAFEDVELPLANGERIHGWFVQAPDARATLLFCHGNAGNISHRIDSIEMFHSLGLDVFIFDYEGYGRSSGRPSEAALYRDAEAAYRHLVDGRGVAPERIIFFGRSLGTAPAAWLAGRAGAGKLIVESPFTSVPDLARELYPAFVIRAFVRNKLETLRHAAAARLPVLVLHSRDDEIIPFEHGRRVFAAAGEPKSFFEMRGGHNDGPARTGPAYRAALDAFVGD